MPSGLRDLAPATRIAGGTAAALGAAVLLGWLTGVERLTDVHPSLPPMVPGTAAMLVLCGLALVVRGSASPSRVARIAAAVAEAAVATLALLTLYQYVADVDLHVDVTLGGDYGDARHPGRPSPHSAVALLLIASSLLSTRRPGRVASAFSAALLLSAVTVVAFAVAGYALGADYVRGLGPVSGMALHALAGVILLLAGTLALRPESAPASWYARAGGGELAARRVIGPALVLPFVFAVVAHRGQEAGLYDEHVELAILTVAGAMLLQLLMASAVRLMRHHESGRRAAEERFRTLFEAAPDAMVSVGPDGRISLVNGRVTDWFGYAPHELVGQPVEILVPERSRGRHGAHRRGFAADPHTRPMGAALDLFARRRDGTEFPVEISLSPVRGADGPSVVATIRDITERRAAEDQTRMVVDRIAEAVTIIEADGTHVHANAAAREILAGLQGGGAGSAGQLGAAVRADGTPVAAEDVPAEITRRTGRDVTDEIVGLPAAAGGLRWVRISTRRLSDGDPPFRVVASFADVTAERENAARLAEAEERFRLAFDDAPIGIALVAPDGRWLKVNRALCGMTGYSEPELLARTFQDMTHPDDLDADLDQAARVLAGETASYELEKRYIRADGSTIWVLLSVSLVRDPAGEPRYFVAQIQDISARKRYERELRHLAEHDPLTGLANRRRLSAEIGRRLAYERRYGGESTLLMVDLDHLKRINDTYGHSSGDRVIRAVADALRARLRVGDVVARLGGDEFAVLLPELAPADAAVVTGELIDALRALRVSAGDAELRVTASFGLAGTADVPPGAGEDALLAAADLAMYDAKAAGRDRLAVAT